MQGMKKEKTGRQPAFNIHFFVLFTFFVKRRKKEQAFLPVLCIRYENFQDSPCLRLTVPKCMPVKKPYCFLSL